ncbi:hypothetical protein [Mycobacterium gastri]|uniref:DUF4190 domain-containing protein n=1 Tax=Mycobacterium gastri TaxID=1777 RepID=A0A1X1VM22_MYCGS|nr:hypothetical protein [Mycobacterium gastri]ETW25613.1 hypothetical protein MGAST_01605 [Mycobacterium gastri 'Wayne']ORV70117.1 hypothetical protein AWC07_05730 [Mycobacterium gastri]
MTTTRPLSVAGAAPEHATNVYASAAFAFSVVGALVLSVVCAITALVQIKNPDEGRGLAIAALATSAGWVALLFALARAHVI